MIDRSKSAYVVKTHTRELNILAQTMLLKRGYEWAAGEREPYSPRGNSWLFMFSELPPHNRDRVLLYVDEDHIEEYGAKVVTLSDIAKWPEVRNGGPM